MRSGRASFDWSKRNGRLKLATISRKNLDSRARIPVHETRLLKPVGLRRTTASERRREASGIHGSTWRLVASRLATVARRGVTAISSASSSIHARILRTSRPFHRDSEGFGIRKMTGNSMARRNKRWRYEYGRIGDCHVGLQSAAGDLSPSAAAPVGPHALRAMPRFRQPAPRQV